MDTNFIHPCSGGPTRTERDSKNMKGEKIDDSKRGSQTNGPFVDGFPTSNLFILSMHSVYKINAI